MATGDSRVPGKPQGQPQVVFSWSGPRCPFSDEDGAGAEVVRCLKMTGSGAEWLDQNRKRGQLIILTRSGDLVHNIPMKKLLISEFKAKCIAVLREAQRTGEPVLITRRGRAIARIEPIMECEPSRRLGVLRGRMRIKGDIVEVDTTQDWDIVK